MTYKVETKEAWVKAWKKEARYLTRAYQCRADPELYDRLNDKINSIEIIITEIGNKMEIEGTWKEKPNSI